MIDSSKDPRLLCVDGAAFSSETMIGPAMGRWFMDEYQTLHLLTSNPLSPDPDEKVDLWIGKRPAYCDRGHYQMCVDARYLGHDGADNWPRYFMSLENAVDEAERYLSWRLYKIP